MKEKFCSQQAPPRRAAALLLSAMRCHHLSRAFLAWAAAAHNRQPSATGAGNFLNVHKAQLIRVVSFRPNMCCYERLRCGLLLFCLLVVGAAPPESAPSSSWDTIAPLDAQQHLLTDVLNDALTSLQRPTTGLCSWRQSTDDKRRSFFDFVSSCYTSIEKSSLTKSLYYDYVCDSDVDDNETEQQRVLAQLHRYARVVFVGDSTMRNQYFGLLCMVQNLSSSFSDLASLNHEEHGDRDIISYTLEDILFQFFPVGQSWKNAETFGTVLREIASMVGVRTLMLINQGIHHNKFDDELCTTDCRVDRLSGLATMATLFYNEVVATGRTDVEVVWRETVPQNFPTANGHYAYHGFCEKDGGCPCVPLSLTMRFGYGLYPRCEPSCYPANIRNVLTNPIIEASKMQLLRVYDALVDAPFNIHRDNFDCTHINSDALIFMNEHVIRYLEKNVDGRVTN